jgi:uncharacterized membrane protein
VVVRQAAVRVVALMAMAPAVAALRPTKAFSQAPVAVPQALKAARAVAAAQRQAVALKAAPKVARVQPAGWTVAAPQVE